MMRRRTFVTAALAAGALPSAAWAQAAFTMGQITPENDLERAFVAAFADESLRASFRTTFLNARVAMPLANSAADSPPRIVELPNNRGRVGLIYSSAARLSAILGPAAPRVVLTGREALQRLRGNNVFFNYRLIPNLLLEASDVETYLATD